MKWEKVKLGELCNKIGSGSTPKGGSLVYVDNGTSFIRSQNVYNLKFSYDGLVHISDDASEKLKNVELQKGDILLNITGDSVARVCKVPEDILPARVNQHVAVVRCKKDILDSDFLAYYLASPYMQAFMLNLAVGKGASRNALTKTMIEDFYVPLLPLVIQKKIAYILTAYDNLIENNQQQIKLLEEAAQRLYKEWFVDLRFPGYEAVEIADGVPKGWEKCNVGDVITSAPKTKQVLTSNILQSGNIPVIDQSKEFIAGYTNEEECLLDYDMPAIVFGDHTRILKFIQFPFARGADGTQIIFSKDVRRLPQSILYLGLKNIDLSNFSYARHFKYLKEEKIILPDYEFAKLANGILSKWFKQIQVCRNKNQRLIEARDRLLPKLMSGEVEV